MKQKIRLIIRGFLYKENWTPISSRRARNKDYTIDFLECQDGYVKLISKLRETYDVSVYFTTYDTTPTNTVKLISETFNPCWFIFSKEERSSQFTTSKKALDSLPTEKGCLNILLRSDMTITDLFIEKICNFNYQKNQFALYVLCKEAKTKKALDVFQCFYDNSIRTKLSKEINKVMTHHLHGIHKKIYTLCILDDESIEAKDCLTTELCKHFFRIYPQ